MKLIQKKFLFILNMIIIASLCFVGQNSVSAQAQARQMVPSIILIHGTVDSPLEINNAVILALETTNVILPSAQYYAITDITTLSTWRLVSVLGLENVSNNLDWNIDDNSAWTGLILLRYQNGSWNGSVEGSQEFSQMLNDIPNDILSTVAKQGLDPLQSRALSAQAVYHFPWTSGTSMQYGSEGVHDNGFPGVVSGWKAVDFLSGYGSAGEAPNNLLAATAGTVNYKCTPATGDVTTAIKVGDLFYTHLNNSSNIYVGKTYASGDLIGSLKTGDFYEQCGYAYQGGVGSSIFHVHLGFPNTGSVTFDGWTLNMSTGIWTNGSITKGINSWFQSGNTSPLTTFGKTSPPNGATGINPSNVRLQWNAAAPNPYGFDQYYKYCYYVVGGTCDFKGPLYTTYVDITNLTAGATYNWQVEVVNCTTSACGPGKQFIQADNGQEWSFTTASFPKVKSIKTINPNPTNASSVSFTVEFDQPVTGVDVSDFSLATTGVLGASVSGVSWTGSAYNVTVNTGTGSGTIQLNLVDNDSIKNSQSSPLGGVGLGNGNYSGETYTIDKIPPTVVSILRANPNPTANTTVAFKVTFSEPVTGVDSGDFTLTPSVEVIGATVTAAVLDYGSLYTVSVNTGSGNGTLRLNLADNNSIVDAASNLLGGAAIGDGNFTGETFEIIKPFNPTSSWTTDYSYAQGWRTNLHPRITGDVNGDGTDDLVGYGSGGVWVALSDGGKFLPVSRWTTDFSDAQGWQISLHPRMVGDVNGDGKDDLVGYGSGGVWVALSDGSKFLPVSSWTTDFSYAQGWRTDLHPRIVGDANGDGKVDLIGFGNGGVFVALSDGSKFLPVSRWTTDYSYNQGWRIELHPRIVGDVNGDGKDDLVGYGSGGVWVALSNGSEFLTVSSWTTDYSYAQGWRTDLHPRTVGDLNGDGMDDLVGFGYGGVFVALSDGSKFLPVSSWTSDYSYDQGWRIELHPRMVGDTNGDGKEDIVGYGSGGVWIATVK